MAGFPYPRRCECGPDAGESNFPRCPYAGRQAGFVKMKRPEPPGSGTNGPGSLARACSLVCPEFLKLP